MELISKNPVTGSHALDNCSWPSLSYDGACVFQTYATNLGANLGSALPQVVLVSQ